MEAYLRSRLEWGSGDADCKHETVALFRIVRHRVCTDSIFSVLRFKREQTEFFPCRKVLVAYERLVDVFVIVHLIFGDTDLGIAAGDEIHVFALGKLDDEFFDERGYILVAYNLAFPFFDIERRLVYFDFKIGFHLDLAAETPMVFDLFAREMNGFCREDVASS